ncbi:MAG: hypothetical protein AAGI34_13610 [Pseudomonadota bacterium]
MSNRKATFLQADVQRALKAAHALGIPVARYEITPDGTIRVVCQDEAGTPVEQSALDNWLAKNEAR